MSQRRSTQGEPDHGQFEIVDEHTTVGADGLRHDVLEAIAVLPWMDQLCPLMPHQYAHQSKADPLAYGVVEHMLKAADPDTYRAYFRGYQSPVACSHRKECRWQIHWTRRRGRDERNRRAEVLRRALRRGPPGGKGMAGGKEPNGRLAGQSYSRTELGGPALKLPRHSFRSVHQAATKSRATATSAGAGAMYLLPSNRSADCGTVHPEDSSWKG